MRGTVVVDCCKQNEDDLADQQIERERLDDGLLVGVDSGVDKQPSYQFLLAKLALRFFLLLVETFFPQDKTL